MGGIRWITENWFTALNAIGVVGGLAFTAASFRSETKTRRIANLLTVTANHRDIWVGFYQNPRLKRVLDNAADLGQTPVTREEEIFVNLVILHLSSVFHTMKGELFINQEGLKRDVTTFFALPIPSAVWERNKVLQNHDFVAYVEACRNWR